MFDSNSFIVLDDAEAQAVLDSASMKGIYKDMLHSLTSAYEAWREKNPDGRFVVPITGEGTAFGGKNTDTVYQGVTNALKADAFKGEWRLIRKTTDDVTTILIAKL